MLYVTILSFDFLNVSVMACTNFPLARWFFSPIDFIIFLGQCDHELIAINNNNNINQPTNQSINTRRYDYEDKINFAVFPGLQGGPHNHTIGALATCLKQAATPEFVEYQKQVLKNCSRMADELIKMGYTLVSGGTDNHLLLVDLKASKGIDGARVERVLELACIATNKNTIPGDTSALTPGGIRMGTPALTSRGLEEDDFAKVAEYFDRAVAIAVKLKASDGGKKLKGFREMCAVGPSVDPDLVQLRKEVSAFACTFPTVGFDESEMAFEGEYNVDFVA